MSSSLGTVGARTTDVRLVILAVTLAAMAVVLASVSYVFLALNLAAGVHDFPYAPGNALIALMAGTVGGLIAALRQRLSIGWLLLAAAVPIGLEALAGEFGPYAYASAGGLFGAWVSWVASWLWVVTVAPIALAFALFPTGQLLSARWRVVAWACVPAVVLKTLDFALAPGSLYWTKDIPNPAGVAWAEPLMLVRGALFGLAVVATPGAAVLSVLLRFRHARGAERQQLKWVAYALTIYVVAFGAGSVVDIPRGQRTFLPTIGTLTQALVWSSVAVAILRYRLFDIDILINRTLVYSSVTAVLAGAFAGLSILTQRLTLAVIGQESQAAVIIAALVVTALFQPLRARVQMLVDRRFYRARYDASRTLERFASRVRDEVELDHLTNSLVAVVQDTMQPAHASLWLRPMIDRNGPA